MFIIFHLVTFARAQVGFGSSRRWWLCPSEPVSCNFHCLRFLDPVCWGAIPPTVPSAPKTDYWCRCKASCAARRSALSSAVPDVPPTLVRVRVLAPRGLWTRRSLDFGLVRLGTRTRLCELGEWVIGRFVCCHSFVRRPGPGNLGGWHWHWHCCAACRDLFFFFFWRACEIWGAATNLQCFVCNLYPGRYGTQLCFKN